MEGRSTALFEVADKARHTPVLTGQCRSFVTATSKEIRLPRLAAYRPGSPSQMLRPAR